MTLIGYPELSLGLNNQKLALLGIFAHAQKNEDQCLEPWLRYHGHLFGYSNLFVVDHNSDDLKFLSILKPFSERSVHVMTLGVGADYRQMGAFVSYGMKQVQHGYDFVLPLDCDEFVAMRDRLGRPTCSPEDVLDYFSNLDSENFVFSFKEPLHKFLVPLAIRFL